VLFLALHEIALIMKSYQLETQLQQIIAKNTCSKI